MLTNCNNDELECYTNIPLAKENGYLHNNWILFLAKKVARLPYVDCLKVSAEEYRLSWTLPPSVTGVIVEVYDGSGEWKQTCGIINKMVYHFKGTELVDYISTTIAETLFNAQTHSFVTLTSTYNL